MYTEKTIKHNKFQSNTRQLHDQNMIGERSPENIKKQQNQIQQLTEQHNHAINRKTIQQQNSDNRKANT